MVKRSFEPPSTGAVASLLLVLGLLTAAPTAAQSGDESSNQSGPVRPLPLILSGVSAGSFAATPLLVALSDCPMLEKRARAAPNCQPAKYRESFARHVVFTAGMTALGVGTFTTAVVLWAKHGFRKSPASAGAETPPTAPSLQVTVSPTGLGLRATF